jgi:hypothetical protein
MNPSLGCLIPDGHPIRLSPLSSSGHLYNLYAHEPILIIHSPWIAGLLGSLLGIDTVSREIVATDLRTGRRIACPVETAMALPNVGVIVLKRDGSIAWSGWGLSSERRMEHVVIACESTGARILDSGEGVDFRSLRLRGSRLTWTDSGVTRSAVLG